MLLEVVVSVVIMAILAGSIAGGISVMMRSQGPIVGATADAHDLQQALSFFPRDIQTGPRLDTAYLTDATTALGCAGPAPTDIGNIVQFDVRSATGGTTRTAYRLAAGEQAARIDRYVCQSSTTDSPGVFGAARVVNIADSVEAAAITDISTSIIGSPTVESVTLEWQTARGRTSSVSGSPRAVEQLPPSGGTPAAGPCPASPLRHTEGFLAFAEQGVELVDGADAYGALATGGDFAFSGANNRISLGSKNTTFTDLDAVYGTDIAVYAGDGIVWPSTGRVEIHNGGLVVVGDFSSGRYATSNPNQTRLHPASSTAPHIFMQNSMQRPDQRPVERTADPIDFAAAFSALRSASRDLSLLPGACPDANHLRLFGQNGVGSYTGSGALWVEFEAGRMNVLNLTLSQLTSITQVNQVGSAVPGTNGTLLLVNVVDAGDLSWTPPTFTQNYPNHVLWNFPNASSITVSANPVWGTLVAPGSHVIADVDMRGNVIARQYTQDGKVIDWQRRYLGRFPWEAFSPS
jgi:choice-of-anchor A domain-containing protein